MKCRSQLLGVAALLLPVSVAAADLKPLRKALTHHVSFDSSLDADFSRGDQAAYSSGGGKKGFMFLEWSKDETPRYFRYAIRPLVEIWNPQNKDWAKMPNAERPMVQVERAPFSRSKWTHVVFTYDNLNAGKAGQGKLYIDGKLQGAIQGWDHTLGWEAEKVQLVLGAA